MPYTKQVWNNGLGGGTPINAARLAHMEDGIENPIDSIPSGTYLEPPAAAEKLIYVSPNGDDGNSGRHLGSGGTGAVKSIARALTLMGTTVRGCIVMGTGVIDAGAGVSLSGYRCSIVGQGAGTVLKPSIAQVGPVLDLTGWLHPGFEYIQEFGNFAVEGDGTTGIAKSGVQFGVAGAGGLAGIYAHDITVSNTGGACFDFGGVELSTFVNLVAVQPVGCYDNDVPYFAIGEAGNGNAFYRCGLRSNTPATTIASGSNGQTLPQATINVASTSGFNTSGSVYIGTAGGLQKVTYTGITGTTFTGCTGGTGAMATSDSAVARPDCVSGCVRGLNGSLYSVTKNLFDSWWFEYQHLPTNGSLFDLRGGDNNTLRDFQYFDLTKITGATNTTHIRLRPPAGGAPDLGGNTVMGLIPGRGTAAVNIDLGVDVQQSGNSIRGTKGYNGSNVQLAAGVGRTFVLLGGTEAAATSAAFVDNSATTTNILIDTSTGAFALVAGSLSVAGTSTLTGLTTFPAGWSILGGGGYPVFSVSSAGILSMGSGTAGAEIFISRQGIARLGISGADLELGTVGKGLKLKEGTNAKMGTVTLAGGTATVPTNVVTASSRIMLTRKVGAGTRGMLEVGTVSSATSFVINSVDSAGALVADTSTIAWVIIEAF